LAQKTDIDTARDKHPNIHTHRDTDSEIQTEGYRQIYLYIETQTVRRRDADRKTLRE